MSATEYEALLRQINRLSGALSSGDPATIRTVATMVHRETGTKLTEIAAHKVRQSHTGKAKTGAKAPG